MFNRHFAVSVVQGQLPFPKVYHRESTTLQLLIISQSFLRNMGLFTNEWFQYFILIFLPHKSVDVCLFLDLIVWSYLVTFFYLKENIVTGNYFTVSSNDSHDQTDVVFTSFKLSLLFSITLVAVAPLFAFLLIHFPLLFGCSFPWFILNWLDFIYFDLSVIFFVCVCAAQFAFVFSPPHFLFCSPVTLINFWPVDSAWVLLKGAATTNTSACWVLKFLFRLFICFVLKTY